MSITISLTPQQFAFATVAARALGLTLEEAYIVTLLTLKPKNR